MVPGTATKLLPENPDEVNDRLKLLLQEKQARKKFDIVTEEIIAVVNKLLEKKAYLRNSKHFCYLNV